MARLGARARTMANKHKSDAKDEHLARRRAQRDGGSGPEQNGNGVGNGVIAANLGPMSCGFQLISIPNLM